MTRARFAERQDPVTVTQIEGVNYFQICLHEQEVQTQRSLDPDGKESEPVTEYEYDFNEFAEPTSVLEPEKVKESPSNYLGYIPTGKKENAQSSAKESTLEQRISDLEDMAAALYGGEA